MKITARNNCTGCGVCVAVCPKKSISLEMGESGFWAPNVDESTCVKCGLCQKKCHANHVHETIALKLAYAAYSLSPEIRSSSSSGGVFSHAAKKIIETGGRVYGATVDADLVIRHVRCATIESIECLRGSKYVQSFIAENIYQDIKNDLNTGIAVLFSGTPCQVGALHSFLDKKYDNLYTITFICHGVPSPLVWEKYIEWQENEHNDKVVAASFRNKRLGWSNFCMKLDFAHGKEYICSHRRDPFMQIFLKNACLHSTCHNCDYKGDKHLGIADIMMADWWGYTPGILKNDSDNKGLSLILLNTAQGVRLFDIFKQELECAAVDFTLNVSNNHSFAHSASSSPNRDKIMAGISHIPINILAGKFARTPLTTRIKQTLLILSYNIVKQLRLLGVYRKFKNRKM